MVQLGISLLNKSFATPHKMKTRITIFLISGLLLSSILFVAYKKIVEEEPVLSLTFSCPPGGVTVTKTAQHCSMVADSVNVRKLFINDIRIYPEQSGVIKMYGGTVAPTGYFMCDGAAVSRTTYSDLFTVIGTSSGIGDGSTTFNLPDTRQRFILGIATSGTGSTLGGTGGTIDHLHTVDPASTVTGSPSATVAATILAGGAASTTHTHTVDIAQFNSGTSNPPFVALNYIIKF